MGFMTFFFLPAAAGRVPLPAYATAFVFGAVVGSFINVCIYRIPRGISLASPRSTCTACGASLGPAELVPLVSYFALRGRCAKCRARISPRYPIVEFLCGALWAALFWRFSFTYEFICYAIFCSVLLAVIFIDADTMRIPNSLVIAATFPALAAALRYSFFIGPPERFRSAYNGVNRAAPLLGLAPCAFFIAVYALTSIASKGKPAIGMGDIKLLIPAGLALGLRQSLLAAFVAVTLGGITGVALLAARVKKRKDPIPFGPFLVIGAYVALFVTFV